MALRKQGLIIFELIHLPGKASPDLEDKDNLQGTELACGLFSSPLWMAEAGERDRLVSVSAFEEELGTDAGCGEKAEGMVGRDREADSVLGAQRKITEEGRGL